MELQPSWVDYTYTQIVCKYHKSKDVISDSFSEISNDNVKHCDGSDEHCGVCINSILPDDILEQVLGHLPFATIIKACSVCKKWNDMVHSAGFIQSLSNISSQKPWYFMFTRDNDADGHVYDPMLSKWYRFQIPCVGSPGWRLVSSSGLVCFMDDVCRRKLYVCNPITRHCRKLVELHDAEFSDYCALAISMNRSLLNYTVSVVKSKQAPGEEVNWDLSIHVYSSRNRMWVSSLHVTLQAWRGGVDSVICGGVLYFVVHLTRILGYIRPRFGVLAYGIAQQSSDLSVDEEVILAPCPVCCMRLLNLEEELVMVGGIEKQGKPGVIRGIGIWVLRGKEWEEVSRMPNIFFHGFGEFDDVFECSGFDKLIYVQSYGSPALLMFDMKSKEWKWARKCPAVKKSTLHLFSGVCFEPRLDSVP